jgi:hypothetical protein
MTEKQTTVAPCRLEQFVKRLFVLPAGIIVLPFMPLFIPWDVWYHGMTWKAAKGFARRHWLENFWYV